MSKNDLNITLIAAMSKNNVIGDNNRLPWRLPTDLAHFREKTVGNYILMGRKTFESLGSKPLPLRKNIVLSKSIKETDLKDTLFMSSFKEAVKRVSNYTDQLIVIGGSQIYQTALPYANNLIITEVDLDIEGDAYFPKITQDWKIEKETDWMIDPLSPQNLRYRIKYYKK